jgi:hypothetical protein
MLNRGYIESSTAVVYEFTKLMVTHILIQVIRTKLLCKTSVAGAEQPYKIIGTKQAHRNSYTEARKLVLSVTPASVDLLARKAPIFPICTRIKNQGHIKPKPRLAKLVTSRKSWILELHVWQGMECLVH